MRRLPVYLLLDISGSMHGEPIESLKTGIQTLVTSLRQDPYSLETAYLSVITFATTAQQVVPLTDLPSFQIPDLQASGTTALGEALSLVAKRREQEITKTTAEAKGDWKPLVFLMTDGAPTDDWKKGLAEFQAQKWGMVIACGAGPGADLAILKQITEIAINMDTADAAAFKSFFKWVSASVSSGSKSVGTTGKEVSGLNELPPPPPELNIVT